MARIGRNQPCPCGSGKKYKKCCGPRDLASREQEGRPRDSEWPCFDETYFRFRLSLRVERPPIWRTFLLRGDASFADLHAAIQACGWTESHLWSFADSSGDELAGVPDNDPMGPVDGMFAGLFGRRKPTPDAVEVPLATHFRNVGDACVYTYDFGDSWEHDVRLEELEKHESQFERALIDGAGVFPPEDCGGVPGWARLVEYHETGRDPWDDAESLEAWLGEKPFEPFDLTRAKRGFGAVLDAQDSEPASARIPRMDEPLVNTLASHMQQELERFVQKVGLDVAVRRATFSDINARFEVEVSTVREDGVVMNKQAEEFLRRCEDFGLMEGDLGREFRRGNAVLRVVGLRPRAKLAVLCEQIRPPRDGLVRVGASLVRKHLMPRDTPHSGSAPGPRLLDDREGETGT